MKHQTIHEFVARDLGGAKVELKQYSGKVLLVVDIASHCGLTPQLKHLQELYSKYKERGFEILAFPSDDFYQQPEDGPEIEMFCQDNYGVTFRIFEKGIVKGKQAQPVYHYLADKSRLVGMKLYPLWNFQKYLIDQNGQVVDYFFPWTKPQSDSLTDAIEKELTKRPVEK
ncbi:MAG: glutathione peroxidase [Bacteroidetes bacterium]|nr:glutathione peroxidase [Bacteroidota bacterium]